MSRLPFVIRMYVCGLLSCSLCSGWQHKKCINVQYNVSYWVLKCIYQLCTHYDYIVSLRLQRITNNEKLRKKKMREKLCVKAFIYNFIFMIRLANTEQPHPLLQSARKQLFYIRCNAIGYCVIQNKVVFVWVYRYCVERLERWQNEIAHHTFNEKMQAQVRETMISAVVVIQQRPQRI